MARCVKSAMIFQRNRKIANCNEFRLRNSAAMSYIRCCKTFLIPFQICELNSTQALFIQPFV
jgi:hypothetical protein